MSAMSRTHTEVAELSKSGLSANAAVALLCLTDACENGRPTTLVALQRKMQKLGQELGSALQVHAKPALTEIIQFDLNRLAPQFQTRIRVCYRNPTAFVGVVSQLLRNGQRSQSKVDPKSHLVEEDFSKR